MQTIGRAAGCHPRFFGEASTHRSESIHPSIGIIIHRSESIHPPSGSLISPSVSIIRRSEHPAVRLIAVEAHRTRRRLHLLRDP
jgi:hypothetical protein